MSISQTINQTTRKLPAWPLYVLSVFPPVWLFYAGVTGNLGVDPVKAMEHQMGQWGLWVLIAVLCVTPLRKFTGVSLIKFRRALGLIGFFYIFLHLLVWLVLDVQIVDQIVKDIIKRPYITIGMAGFVLMIPLAVTSNNRSVRKLGPKWKKLHWLTYPAVLLGAIHFVWLVKGIQLEPLLYLGAVLVLLATRIRVAKRRVARA